MSSLEMHSAEAFELFRNQDSIDVLEKVLQRGDIDLELKDQNGSTALLWGLKLARSDTYIKGLLNANANPNIFNSSGVSPLLVALRRSTLTIAHELINQGADVNARSPNGETILYEIVRCPNRYNPEAVYFLLFYGADVNVNVNSCTPFSISLFCGKIHVPEILIDYYDGGLDGVLYDAIDCDVNIAFKLIKMGANVNCIKRGKNLLEEALLKGSAILFKLIWERFDYAIILYTEESFLEKFFSLSMYMSSSDDWLDCLTLILNSRVSSQLAEQYNCECYHRCDTRFFYQKFLNMCCSHYRNVKVSDRLRIIYFALSLSVTVTSCDVLAAYNMFRFNEEFEVLMNFIYYKDFYEKSFCIKGYELLVILLGIDDNLEDFWNQQELVGYFNRSHYKLTSSHPVRSSISEDKFRKLSDTLLSIPEFPSLLELSRTASRKYIRKAYKIREPYQFHDAVKLLNIPQYIKDVIKFKVPIYHI